MEWTVRDIVLESNAVAMVRSMIGDCVMDCAAYAESNAAAMVRSMIGDCGMDYV